MSFYNAIKILPKTGFRERTLLLNLKPQWTVFFPISNQLNFLFITELKYCQKFEFRSGPYELKTLKKTFFQFQNQLYFLYYICFAFKGPKRPKGPNWVQLMNLAQASLMSFFSLTPKIIQVRICQDKPISDKRSAQLWGMLQFEFSFLICPDHICLLKCMQNAKFVASSCCYSSLDAFCITGRAAQLQLGHARMFLLRALDLDLDGLSRRNRPACDNGEGTELGSHGWPGVTQREKKNGKVMQNEKCHFYSL